MKAIASSLIHIAAWAACTTCAWAHGSVEHSGAQAASSHQAAPREMILAQAQSGPAVKVERAWVRSSVPGQQATGGFMTLMAGQATRLVAVSSPAAGSAEIHEMKMEGDVMTMRPVAGLDLPAGKAVELRPGGYHLMLQSLKQPLLAGSLVPLTLVFRDATGAESRMELSLPVRLSAPTDGHKH